MAAGTDSADLSPFSGGSDLEEGEFVADPDLEEGEFVAGPDDDIRHEGDGLPEIKRPLLEDVAVVDGGALPSPTSSRERDSDGTITDVDADAGALAQALSFPCPASRREFASKKAASGHMGSHGPHGRRQGDKERPPVMPAVGGGWAVTGKRGSLGGRSGSSESEGVVDSAATVVSDTEPVIDAMPIAFASSSSSASSGKPTNQVVVHPPCSPQFLQRRQPAASWFCVAQAQPTVAQGQQLAEAARQFVAHRAAAPQAVAQHVQRTPPPPTPPVRGEQGRWFSEEEWRNRRYATPQSPGGHAVGHKLRQNNEAPAAPQAVAHHVQRTPPPPTPPARGEQGRWFSEEEWRNRRYATPQSPGGHAVGHKLRQNNEAPAAGLDLGVGDPKPARSYPCKYCPCVFTSGQGLGGHMRKYHPGNVTPKKPGARPKVSARELGSALALSSPPMPPATMEATPAQPAVAPSPPVVLRLFGVNIVVTPPAAAAAQETSSAVAETDQSFPASTNFEQ